VSIEKRERLYGELTSAVRLFIAGSSLYSQRVAEKLRMHPTDLQFFNVLEMQGPLTPGALARLSGLTSGGVTVVLDRLERAGYVVRRPHPTDRRSVLVSIAAAKRRMILANYRTVEQRFREMLSDFSERDLETILRFFTRSAADRA
jgi:MarR family transcriptional regulator, organic hydroperoxide resistance regulator